MELALNATFPLNRSAKIVQLMATGMATIITAVMNSASVRLTPASIMPPFRSSIVSAGATSNRANVTGLDHGAELGPGRQQGQRYRQVAEHLQGSEEAVPEKPQAGYPP